MTLIGTLALPLVEFPAKALRFETQSAYRMELQRLADLAFASFKEKIYKREISWETLTHSSNDKYTLCNEKIEVDLVGPKKTDKKGNPSSIHEFIKVEKVHSVGKKGKDDAELRLVTFSVTFRPDKNRSSTLFLRAVGKQKKPVQVPVFVYRVLVKKTSAAVSSQDILTNKTSA